MPKLKHHKLAHFASSKKEARSLIAKISLYKKIEEGAAKKACGADPNAVKVQFMG